MYKFKITQLWSILGVDNMLLHNMQKDCRKPAIEFNAHNNFWSVRLTNQRPALSCIMDSRHCITMVSKSRSPTSSTRYIFPRVILYKIYLILLIYGGLGSWGWGLRLGFWVWDFQLMGFGACGVRPFGLGLSI